MVVVEEDDENNKNTGKSTGRKIFDEEMEPTSTKTYLVLASSDGTEIEVLEDVEMFENQKSKIRSTKFPCKNCDKRFASVRSLNNHQAIAHAVPVYKHICSVCGMDFINHRKLIDHIAVNHDKLSLTSKCEKCERAFRSERELRMHERRAHKKSKPFVCTICGQRLTLKEVVVAIIVPKWSNFL